MNVVVQSAWLLLRSHPLTRQEQVLGVCWVRTPKRLIWLDSVFNDCAGYVLCLSTDVCDRSHGGGSNMKTMIRRSARYAMLIFVVGVAACDDATSIERLKDVVVVDAAMLAADATIEEARMFIDPFLFSFPPSLASDSPARPSTGAAGRTWSRTKTVTFFDSDGAEQDAYDALVTEEVHVETSSTKLVERERFRAETQRARSMVASGLAGEEVTRTWNGTSTSHTSKSGVLEDGSERSHTMDGSAVYNDVVVPIRGTEPRYPLSGTIERSMVAVRTNSDGATTKEVDIVITFDGTQFAQAVVNGEEIEIDLAAKDRRKPFRKKKGG